LGCRIGRTGRCGKTGVATTFINTRHTNETILLDLKHLLKEAKQVRGRLAQLHCLTTVTLVTIGGIHSSRFFSSQPRLAEYQQLARVCMCIQITQLFSAFLL
jgi:superfamily II DNA/RNA helicase